MAPPMETFKIFQTSMQLRKKKKNWANSSYTKSFVEDENVHLNMKFLICLKEFNAMKLHIIYGD